jgi:hypothetical protein
MTLTPELLITLGGLLTILSSIVTGWVITKRTAKKEDIDEVRRQVTELREELKQVQDANDNWRYGYARLYSHDLALQRLLTTACIVFPDMPNFNFIKNEAPSPFNPYNPYPNGSGVGMMPYPPADPKKGEQNER